MRKRLNVLLPIRLFNAFKAATAKKGLTMSEVVEALIKGYLRGDLKIEDSQ